MSQHSSEDGGNRTKVTGTVVVSAVAAGVIAYLIRRARQKQQRQPMEAGREFLVKKVIPELKPALLAMIDDLEATVDDAFKRAEKVIKKL